MLGQRGYVRIVRRINDNRTELSAPVRCEVVYVSDYDGLRLAVKLLDDGPPGWERGSTYHCHRFDLIPERIEPVGYRIGEPIIRPLQLDSELAEAARG